MRRGLVNPDKGFTLHLHVLASTACRSVNKGAAGLAWVLVCGLRRRFFMQVISIVQTKGGLSYAELGSLRYKGATARHAIHGGQWRRLDRKWLGRDGPFQSLISRRLPQGPERIRV